MLSLAALGVTGIITYLCQDQDKRRKRYKCICRRHKPIDSDWSICKWNHSDSKGWPVPDRVIRVVDGKIMRGKLSNVRFPNMVDVEVWPERHRIINYNFNRTMRIGKKTYELVPRPFKVYQDAVDRSFDSLNAKELIKAINRYHWNTLIPRVATIDSRSSMVVARNGHSYGYCLCQGSSKELTVKAVGHFRDDIERAAREEVGYSPVMHSLLKMSVIALSSGILIWGSSRT